MSGETANIAEVAEKISKEIFSFFKWKNSGRYNENFPCHNPEIHSKSGGGGKSQFKAEHPCDCVFSYYDPYKNRVVYLLVDLKSYASGSIQKDRIRKALEGLAKSVDCAESSGDWQKNYVPDDKPWSVNGLLFIYNHDNCFDKDFEGMLGKIKTESLPVAKGQNLYVVSPLRIKYLMTVCSDIRRLFHEGEMPRDYSFFYPELTLHKTSGDQDQYPATIELLCAPYMIVQWDEYKLPDLDDGHGLPGYIIYYNQPGSDYFEFLYLIDSLSRYQILNSKKRIMIRIAHDSPDVDAKANFIRAKSRYISDWGLDEHKRNAIERIDFDIVPSEVSRLTAGALAWRSE